MRRDPLATLPRNQPCWCGSGRKYKLCHGRGPRWPPGAPLPDTPPEHGGVWVAPDVALAPSAIADLTRQVSGVPIWGPSEEPEQRPLVVDSFSARLAELPARNPLLTLSEAGMMRNDALAALGLASEDEEYLRKRLRSISDADHDDLARGVFSTGKETLDRLQADALRPDAPTALWAGGSDPRRMTGQTLLWADHYLAEDRVADALLRHPEVNEAEDLVSALAREARMRGLLEAGAIALVPQSVIAVLTAHVAYEATDADLENEELVQWVMSQLVVEGPTRREVVFLTARDHDRVETFYVLNRIERDEQGRAIDEEGHFKMSALVERYDPDHDYGPWIAQTRRQTTAKLLQQFNFDLAIAEAVGGNYVATSPFAGRLLARKGGEAAIPQPLIWAQVPALPDADAETLARIAAEDETVEALRRTVRRTFSTASRDELHGAADELALQLEEDAALLQRAITREDRWKVVVPVSLSVAGIVIGGIAGGPLGAAAGVLGGLAGLAPARADRAARRENPAYAIVLAERAAEASSSGNRIKKPGGSQGPRRRPRR